MEIQSRLLIHFSAKIKGLKPDTQNVISHQNGTIFISDPHCEFVCKQSLNIFRTLSNIGYTKFTYIEQLAVNTPNISFATIQTVVVVVVFYDRTIELYILSENTSPLIAKQISSKRLSYTFLPTSLIIYCSSTNVHQLCVLRNLTVT